MSSSPIVPSSPPISPSTPQQVTPSPLRFRTVSPSEFDPDDSALLFHLAGLELGHEAQYPERTLDRILERIFDPESRHVDIYAALLSTAEPDQQGEDATQMVTTKEQVKGLLMGCLRPSVSDMLEDTSRPLERDRIRQIGKDTETTMRAVYLHVVRIPSNTPTTSPSSSSTPHRRPTTTTSTDYWYIGQATSLPTRLSQHRDFRFRRENPSLHNYAVDRSSSDAFHVLAALSPRDAARSLRPDLLLNLLEMWCAVLFWTLASDRAREDWLDADVYDVCWDGAVHGLNVALPLEQGLHDDEETRRAFEALRTAESELARQYYADVKKGRLRPRASRPRIRGAENVVAATGEAGAVLVRRWGDGGILAGIVLGVTGTLGVIWLRRFWLSPGLRSTSGR